MLELNIENTRRQVLTNVPDRRGTRYQTRDLVFERIAPRNQFRKLFDVFQGLCGGWLTIKLTGARPPARGRNEPRTRASG